MAVCSRHADDIIIFSEILKENLRHIIEVLKLLNNAEMTITLKEYSFLSAFINHLGHIIAPGKPHVAAGTTEAIEAPQYPNKSLKLRPFPELCNVY